MDEKGAKAEAKAAAAHAKALRPWYKKKRFILPLGLVVVAIVAQAAGGGGDKSSDKTDTDGSGGGKSKEKVAAIGEAVRDGKFEFTVKGIECGKGRVGNSTFGKDPQGQYCFLSVHVKNVGKEAQSMFGDNQKLYDSEGREFSADTEAAIYLDESKTLYEEINPGNEIDGIIIYDIPKGAAPVRVELHDSAFSGGVVVNLK